LSHKTEPARLGVASNFTARGEDGSLQGSFDGSALRLRRI
jgi:hypothetical protein